MGVKAPASRRSPEQADERLLVEAAQKDPARFADLYELHFELVYAFIVRRVGTREAAEDLTSDVFYKALQNLKRYEWRGVPFGAWLLRIAANAITDRAKRSGREIAVEDPPEVAMTIKTEPAENCGRLFRLVNGLSEDQRTVVVMRFAEEKSIREIADAMERSEGAVKQLQFRALETLRDGFNAKQAAKPRRMKATSKSGGRNG